MRRPQGYSTLVEPGAATAETDTMTCGHCQHITHVKPFCDPAELGGLCKVCDKLICKHCYRDRMKYGKPCKTWEARMEVMESKDRFLRSAGLIE